MSHHIPQHELWSKWKIWREILREIFPYHVRSSLFSDLVCVISVFQGSSPGDKHASVLLGMELFFKGLNPLDCIHSRIIENTFSGNILKCTIPDDL